MSIRIVGGRAGRVWPWVTAQVKAAYEQGQRCLVIVPEQYTLQAEQELIQALQVPGFFEVQVFSPSRLTRKVFEMAGQDGRIILDEKGRRMALSLCLTQCREKLKFYQSAAERQGLPQRLSALIADMKRGGLDIESYRSYLDTLPKGASRTKQEDVLLLWEAYEKQMAGRFADGEDVQRAMLEKLPGTGLFKDAQVYLYGFDVLPQSLVELLCAAAVEGAGLAATMTMDRASARDGEIFGPMRRSAMRLRKALETRGLEVKWEYLETEPLSAAPALRHLEANLYAYPAQLYEGRCDAVKVHSAPTPYDEAVYVAGQMRKLHEAGVPWGDMAVAMAAGAGCESVLPMVMRSFGIPFYMNNKAAGAEHPLIRYVLGGLRAVSKGWPQGEMLLLAKSIFSPLTEKEGFELENYALENGIHLYKWARPFTRGDHEKFEPMRQRLMAPLEALKKGLAQATDAKASLTAVFLWLKEAGAYEILLKREEALLQRGLHQQAAQSRQVWKHLLATLDQLNELMDAKRVPISRLPQWLQAGLDQIEIGALPPQPDTVQAGPVGHLMPGRLQALFVMGLQDGALAAEQNSLLLDEEREAAQEATGLMLGSAREDLNQLSRSDLYKTCALPSARLYMTYSQAAADGQTQRPNAVIAQIKNRIFTDLTIGGGAAWASRDEALWAPEAALERLGGVLREETVHAPETWQQALRWLWQSDAYHHRTVEVLEGFNASLEAKPLQQRTALELFSEDRTSISRLEEYAQCPFKHFVRYGLGPVERRDFAFHADEKGTFFHDALMGYVRRAIQDEQWPQVKRERSDEIMDQVLKLLVTAWEDGPLGENRAARSLAQRYTQIVKRAAWMITQHAAQSQFRTMGTEVVFGQAGGLPPIVLTLSNGEKAALQGKIDRIDRYDGDDGVYLRVVDYKSSTHRLEPDKLWYGLQLQLVLYLKAALGFSEEMQPSGAFYFTVKDPLVTTDEDIREAAEKEIARELKLRGVVLSDVKIVRAMDGEDGFSLGTVLKKNGEPAKGAAVLSMTQMRNLMDHAHETARQLWEKITDGRINVSPAATHQWRACEYCSYKGVCRFDEKLHGDCVNHLPPMTLEELQERLT